MKATMAWRCRARGDFGERLLITMANVIPPDHVDDVPVVEPNQPDDVPVIPEPVLVDEDKDPEEEEFKEEEEAQEEECKREGKSSYDHEETPKKSGTNSTGELALLKQSIDTFTERRSAKQVTFIPLLAQRIARCRRILSKRCENDLQENIYARRDLILTGALEVNSAENLSFEEVKEEFDNCETVESFAAKKLMKHLSSFKGDLFKDW
ncbi:hypothetical protein Tco_0422325 [Tanacetum coccineum]